MPIALISFILGCLLCLTTWNVLFSFNRSSLLPVLVNATQADTAITEAVDLLRTKSRAALAGYSAVAESLSQDQQVGHGAGTSQPPGAVTNSAVSEATDWADGYSSKLAAAMKTMDTLQLSLEKLDYEIRNLPAPEHVFPFPPQQPLPLSQQRAAHRASKGNGTVFVARNMIFGMSSVARRKDYVLSTVTSLITMLSPQERLENKIVVYNAMVPPSAHHEIQKVETQFAAEIASGLLEIITNPSPNGYVQLKNESALRLRWGDQLDRVKWRAKHALDTATVMAHCYAQKYDYYVHLEDDIRAAHNYPTHIREWIDEKFAMPGRVDWTILSTYNPWRVKDMDKLKPYNFFGVIGQVFRLTDLPTIASFLRKNFDDSPLDWLFVDLLTKFKGQIIIHSPSYFQHEGRVSSLQGKTQSSHAIDFVEDGMSRMRGVR